MPNQMIALQARNPQIADPSRQTAQFANMMNMARQQEAAQLQAQQAQQTMEFARNKEGREAELQPFAVNKASSEAGSAKVKYVMDFFKTSEIAIDNSRSPQQAMALGARIKQMFPEPEFQQAIDETLSTIPQDPNQFEAWRQDSLMRTMDAKDQVAKEYIKQTTGTEERVIGLPKYGSGAATEVPGSRISVAEGMRYLKTDTGDIIAVPNEKPGSFTTPPPAGGAPGRGAAAGQYGAAIENAVTQLAPGTIVSGRGRTPARNAEVGGVSNSYHLGDNARDLQPAKGQSLDQLAAKLAPLKQQGFDVIIERRKNHVHVEPGPGMARGGGTPTSLSGPTPIVKGTGPKDAKSTEAERRFGTVAKNMIDALNEATTALSSGADAAAPGTGEYLASQIPFYGDEIRKFAQSGPRQQFEAALMALLDGVTYVSTGAGVTKPQEISYKNTYIPTYQDTPKSRKSKLERAVRFIGNLKDAAGVRWTPDMNVALDKLKATVSKIDFGDGGGSGISAETRAKYGL